VTVVTAPYDKSDIKPDGFISRQEIAGVNLIVVNSGDSNRLSLPKRAFRALRFALVSMYYALTQPCDVVIASSGPITIGMPMIIARMIRGKKTVFEVRDLWPSGGIELGLIKSGWQKRMALWFEKFCYEKADLVVPCSPGMEASINQRFPSRQTLVIPNACDSDVFDIGTTPPERMPNTIGRNAIFLYAGSLGLMDDCRQIIQGLGTLKKEPVSIVFIGDGAEREALEEQAKATGNPNIHFLGLITKTEVAKWFSIATASFVTFKDFEVLHTSSPNKMFDSFAAGVPVIQSTKGWIRELIDKERCGLNVEANEPDTFSEAIMALANNKVLREELSMNAKRMAQTRFNRNELSSRYLSAISTLKTT
jgi:glycosyltransferase involved in cell wall biosynthesis